MTRDVGGEFTPSRTPRGSLTANSHGNVASHATSGMAVALRPLHGRLRFDVEAVREQLRDADGSALADAYLACVEAADSIGRALVREQQGDGLGAEEDLHEALAAVRAASMSVRFSLVRCADLSRESEASSKVRT